MSKSAPISRAGSLLLADLQARLTPTILNINEILRRSRALAQAAVTLRPPVLITEQCPKGIHTDPSVIKASGQAPVMKNPFRHRAQACFLSCPYLFSARAGAAHWPLAPSMLLRCRSA